METSEALTSLVGEYMYRFEDRRYSIADEYGDHAYTSHKVACLVFPVLKVTKCGVWITFNYEEYPRLPQPRQYTVMHNGQDRRFINLQANKKFACPTLELAAESYIARKNRQIRIYQARINSAEIHKEALARFMLQQGRTNVSEVPRSTGSAVHEASDLLGD